MFGKEWKFRKAWEREGKGGTVREIITKVWNCLKDWERFKRLANAGKSWERLKKGRKGWEK